MFDGKSPSVYGETKCGLKIWMSIGSEKRGISLLHTLDRLGRLRSYMFTISPLDQKNTDLALGVPTQQFSQFLSG